MSDPTRYFFSVITPTLNRADTLARTYASLCEQTFHDFEWIVMDDGSTDHTAQTVAQWQAQASFPIRYEWQTNQHKKVAINRGVALASGQWTIILDSDDTLQPHSLAAMAAVCQSIPSDQLPRFAAVTGLCVRPDGVVVGDTFPADPLDVSVLDLTFRYAVRGEKFGCTRTDVLRAFPYPQDMSGYVPESIVWRAIAKAGYLSRCVNQVFRVYYPTPGALTSQAATSVANLPGLCLLARDTLVTGWPWFRYQPVEFLKAAARYTRFRLWMKHAGLPVTPSLRLQGAVPYVLVTLALPVGVGLYMRDRWHSVKAR